METVTGTFGAAAAADTIIVVKRSRGQADATLHVTGRDVEERELALRFSPEAGTWALLGDAAEYELGDTRRELLDAVREHGALTPKQAAEVTTVGYELAKKTMQRMTSDRQLRGDRGTCRTPVPGVPMSPDDPLSGTKGQEGQGFSRDGVMRETAHDRAARLAGSGRVTIRRLESDLIVAKVQATARGCTRRDGNRADGGAPVRLSVVARTSAPCSSWCSSHYRPVDPDPMGRDGRALGGGRLGRENPRTSRTPSHQALA